MTNEDLEKLMKDAPAEDAENTAEEALVAGIET